MGDGVALKLFLVEGTNAMALPKSCAQWGDVIKSALSIDKKVALRCCPRHLVPTLPLSGSPVTRWGAPGQKRGPDERGSAVLILLSPLQTISDGGVATNDLFLTLTMRSSKLKSHGGQMSFPGGRCDRVEGGGWETAVQAAMREGEEEVGLRPGSYTVLGELSPTWSIPSQSWVTPVVALGLEGNPSSVAEGSNIVPPLPHADTHNASPDEVDSLHYIGLKGLLTNSKHTHHQQVVHYSLAQNTPKVPLLMPCFFAANESPVDRGSVDMGYALPDISGRPPPPPVDKMQPWCESDAPYFAETRDGSRGLSYVHKSDFKGVSLTWGMTAMMIAELTCRLSLALQYPSLGEAEVEPAAHNLAERLPSSGLVLIDENHPRGVPLPPMSS